MIYLDLPYGTHGVGLAGDSLARALSTLVAVEPVGRHGPPSEPLPGPLLERLRRTFRPTYAATRNVAYTVFEDDLRFRRLVGQAKGLFHTLVPVSHWCATALRDAGLTNVTVIHQGVDISRFHPRAASRRRHRSRFVVFSGGKFELRKGQDVVLRAFRIFAARHEDAYLVANWHNPWRKFVATMAASPHHALTIADDEPLADALARWFVAAGLDLDRVEILSHVDQPDMAAVYANSDVGLFPNRCEGGTNLVMMEYMACGKPVIATDYSGHRDVLTDANSIRLRHWKPLPINQGGETIGCWCEPDVDEVVEGLEQAYWHRDRLARLGDQAAADLSEWTWERMARGLLPLLVDC